MNGSIKMTEFYSLLENNENLIQSIMGNISNITIEDHPRGDVIYFAHPEEMLTPWKINSYFPFIMTTYIITFIVGVTGNIVVIAVMACDSASKNVTSIFLVSLAVADLLLLVIYVPLDVAHYFVVQWDKDGTICRTAAYAEMVSAFASVLNLVAVTLERFVVIVFPIKSRSLCTMGNCKQLMVVVWMFSLLLSLPVIASKSTEKTTMTNYEITVMLFSCKEHKDWRGSAVAIYRLVALFGLPLVLMIICYAWVIIELWISTKTMDELTNHRNDQKLRRMELHVGINQETHSPSLQPHRMILRSHTTTDSRDVKRARKQAGYQDADPCSVSVFGVLGSTSDPGDPHFLRRAALQPLDLYSSNRFLSATCCSQLSEPYCLLLYVFQYPPLLDQITRTLLQRALPIPMLVEETCSTPPNENEELCFKKWNHPNWFYLHLYVVRNFDGV
ncbi:allatostatin-A receptor-like [Limulus polyphemus]|uniref:Allatostatin-A receptor-like n=1 Tax=Limulus polyphemus TaxID=6850 RepID=A0ABM1SFW0_LIMPO|nr:allatostatin-A receptor-like [Limulus polyphemus]